MHCNFARFRFFYYYKTIEKHENLEFHLFLKTNEKKNKQNMQNHSACQFACYLHGVRANLRGDLDGLRVNLRVNLHGLRVKLRVNF